MVHATRDTKLFCAKIPKKVVKVLNLVDVVAGGDGFGQASGRGIDPRTGEIAVAQLSDPKQRLAEPVRFHGGRPLPSS